MKTLGLLGGTSWHATLEYYRHINQAVNNYYGDNTNPPLIVYTLNQSRIHHYQKISNWEAIAAMLIKASLNLEKAGAQTVMFCANTPHKVYQQVQQEINVPILHIADATAQAIQAQQINKVCFLGTKYSMQEDFVTQRIASIGILVYTPQDAAVIQELHRIIQEELTYGNILPASKKYVIDVIHSFQTQGVILGCTEFPLMLKETDLNIPIFNTTTIHAQAGVQYILDTNQIKP